MRYDPEATEPAQPMQSDQYGQPVEPVQYRQPVEPVQPGRPARPAPEVVEPVRPARSTLDDPYVPPSYSAGRVVYLILGIVEALLLIRLILKLLAANPDAGFTSLIYGITGPLVALFLGVFPNAQGNGSVLEAATILAMVVYALLAWAIVRLIAIMSRRRMTPTPTA